MSVMRTLHRSLVGIALVGAATACGSGKVDGDEAAAGTDSTTPTADARLIADVYTWNCVDQTTGDRFQGAFGQVVTLEHAPAAVERLALPPVGQCDSSLDMFPIDAGVDATDVPGLSDEPDWESDVAEGSLERLNTGFYRDDVFPSTRTCYTMDEVMGGGTRLTAAGDLTGAATPAPAEAPNVDYAFDSSAGIDFGDTVDVTWDSHAWDEVWVQVRREREGEAWETVTCNATGLGGFTLDGAVWSLMDESLDVQQNNLYVGFQSASTDSSTGADVATVTRAIAVAVIQE